ncbi:hypothetical protein PLESTB_000737300 [Pleodorina starrii]|uniref:Cytokinin riboside 5'-monophosphate phosphoribohydrolase n=1 Tax=Pleodorina starrii TaxID=330485 RepID=A0A9W6F1N5_9CHLO|nr:hypothetical protein PLESTM_000187000 [Pleodorina starrii]GLC53368.1 hypothetical protein PLESTB_000737300 [Pleodorina starrii]GLC67162.1 hypothetical protein PLESTF_000523800 [Pleodorina starrii]
MRRVDRARISLYDRKNCCGPLSKVAGRQGLRTTIHRPRAILHDSSFARARASTVDRTMASRELRKLCVFCGASTGTDPVYMASAKELGEHFVRENIGLVYGGGTVGLMGEIARTVQSGLGDDGVMGVLPEALAPREVSGALIGRTHIVADMHTRKAMMAQHADGFIAMPGGLGTLEELLEVLTWQQLGFHSKPVALLNVNGFFDPLLEFFQHAVKQGFVRAHHNNVIVSTDPQELIEKMRAFEPPVSLVAAALNSTVPVGLDVSVSSRQAEEQQQQQDAGQAHAKPTAAAVEQAAT